MAGKVKALRVRLDNPTRDVEPPERGVAKAKVYLFPSEFLALVGCEALELAQRRAYAVTVYLDPRAGEVEALHWEDLDLEHGTVHVHRAADPDGGEIRETKGRAARRVCARRGARRRSRGEGGGRVSARSKRLACRRFEESSANRSRPLAASHIWD